MLDDLCRYESRSFDRAVRYICRSARRNTDCQAREIAGYDEQGGAAGSVAGNCGAMQRVREPFPKIEPSQIARRRGQGKLRTQGSSLLAGGGTCKRRRRCVPLTCSPARPNMAMPRCQETYSSMEMP